MTFSFGETAVIAACSGALSFFGSWVGFRAAVSVHLSYLRRDIDAAHERLDAIEAPRASAGRKPAREALGQL